MEMDENLSYQQARRIRKTTFSNLLSDQLLESPTISSAVKRTLSLKLQSKVKGIKEKFDPLNIAKTLTMGSSLGPALLGRLTGRSKKDIEYFSGRLRPISVRSGSKITAVPKEGEELVEGRNINISGNKGINEQLLKIYKLLKKSQDSDKRRKELDRNFDEERSSEAEKRHQQLLKKLDMLMGNGTATKTAEPSGDTGGGLLDSISDILMGILESRFGNLLKLAGSRFLGGLLASGPLLALGTLGAIAYFIVNAASEEANRQTAEGVSRAMDVSTEGAAIVEAADVDIVEKRKQRLLADRPSSEKSYFNSKKDIQLQKKYLEKIGFDPVTGLTEAEKEQGFNALDDDGNPIKKSTAQKVTPEKNKSQEAPEKVQSGGAEMTTDAMGNITGQSNTFEQVPTGGNTQRLNTAMAENVNALLTKQKADDNVTVNNIAKSVGKKTQEIAKLNEIAVRNDEPTLLRMIMNSTSFV